MKILANILLASALSAGATFAQTLKDDDVPSDVSNKFKNEYSNATETQWEKDGENYSVTFSVPNEQDVNVVYDQKGKVKEKYMSITTTDVPLSIKEYLKTNHSEQKVRNYWMRQLSDQKIYKVELMDNSAGLGKITGTANGTVTAINPDNATNTTRIDTSASLSNKQMPVDALVIYFDKMGHPLTLDKVAKEEKIDSLRTKGNNKIKNDNTSSSPKEKKKHN